LSSNKRQEQTEKDLVFGIIARLLRKHDLKIEVRPNLYQKFESNRKKEEEAT